MNFNKLFYVLAVALLLSACSSQNNELANVLTNPVTKDSVQVSENETSGNFQYVADQFADLRVLRYQVPDFDNFIIGNNINTINGACKYNFFCFFVDRY